MSLRSKLEAVIYAAEEPVTLAQLAALFATEALEWRAEQDAAAAVAEAEAQPPLPLPIPMIDEGLAYLGLEQTPEFYAAQATAQAEAAAPPEATDPSSETAATPDAGAAAQDAETEAKRQARARDREVKAALRQLLDEIIASYDAGDRGIEIRE